MTERADRDRLRLDKWIWHARFAKSRTKAAEMVRAGFVRVNGQRIEDPARMVRAGDVLTLALARTAVAIRILHLSDRRLGPEPARALYEDAAGPASDAGQPFVS